MSRKITIRVFKHNPQSKISKPHFVSFEIDETPKMTLFVALSEIRAKYDADLSFDFVCRAGVCGSCAMLVNGKAKLACKTLTSHYKNGEIELMPLPVFKLIKDLSVDTNKWMNSVNKRIQNWLHTDKITQNSKLEKRVEPQISQDVFELDRCIECGICIAACGVAIARADFVGAYGLNRIARYSMDPLDERTDDDFYKIVGDENGVYGCVSLMACELNCPKNLPLLSKIAFIRRKINAIKRTK
ncbi:fumarate reductase iron-sulfur subunit [Campylobacter majalis]|uniref:fumarate reductase iron-sulfur subunit n=1 Tax=Campylobacter majalis TaxID=2790656 RepID=UPI003D69DB2B